MRNRRPRPGIQPETYVAPPAIIPSTVRPNIRPAIRPHNECWAQEWSHEQIGNGRLGDVRSCAHGKVQILTETTSTRIAGPGTHWWRDLRPWLDRREYRLAVAALQAGEDF